MKKYEKIFISSKLPQPLSEQTLQQYFDKMFSGDKEAREKIIKHNIRIVFNRVNSRFKDTPYEEGELVETGIIGLLKSIDTFNPNKNIKFISYASRCIDNEILIYLRKNKKTQNNISIETIIGTSKDGRELTIKDTMVDEKANQVLDYEKEEMNKVIRQLVENLPSRDRQIISLYFGFWDDQCMTQKEIAELFGISRAYVSKRIQDNLEKIKKQLQNQQLIEISTTESNHSKVKKRPKTAKNK